MSTAPQPEKLVFSTALASPRVASEDRLLVQRLPRGLLVVVADGAGGLAGGARAAALFVEHVRARVTSAFAANSEAAWITLSLEADARITHDPVAGETTGVALLVTDEMIIGASVGDSEAWLVTNDDFDALTIDQKRKRFGSGRAAPVAFTRSLGVGNLVVGTDGLFSYVKPEALCDALRRADLHAAARKVIALVPLPSGALADDVAVVVVGGRRTNLR
jgi:serine/threonine protein phosphatase PrpC